MAVPAMAEVKDANAGPANTTASDETLVIGFGSEPSTIWGAPEGKTEKRKKEQLMSKALRLFLRKPATATASI